VTLLNRALTWLFDAIMGPLDRLPPMAGLGLLSLATAVAVLLAFKWTADQRALVASKRAMQAALFEMRLFNDDVGALLRAQGEVLRHTLTYLRLSFAPTLWLLVPVAALMLHMEFRFGYTGLTVGDAVLVKARLADPASGQGDLVNGEAPRTAAITASLESPDALPVETPAVVLPSAREIAWRIRPKAAGSYELRVHLGNSVLTKTAVVSDAIARRSPVRPAGGFLNQLRYPSETPLPDGSGLTAITIAYPERPFSVAGWDIGPSGVYLALTLIFAFALKGTFGVVM
jgi:hypothetical protein